MPRLAFSAGTTEALKWLGLAWMTADHINKYLLGDSSPWLFDVARVCLPLFVVILAFNLARPGAFKRGAYTRTMTRLAMAGTVASVPFIALGGLGWGWWPLNVMFTLLAVTATAYFIERGGPYRWAAGGVFLLAGSSVEFWWPALALGLFAWQYARSGGSWAAAGAVLSIGALALINGNHWALASLPLFFLASKVDVPLARHKWAFYVYYPLHLAMIWLVRAAT